MASSTVLFEDIFVVDRLDPDGKKFDKVTRIEARSHNCDMFMHLDINSEIYPMAAGDKFTMALAHTLSLDGTPDTGYYAPGAKKSLADKYEYVMHGKLYKISEREGKSPKAGICIVRWPSDDASGRTSSCLSLRARPEDISSYKEALKDLSSTSH